MKKASIIVVNWDGKEVLRNCLNSIKKHTKYPDYEVTVVDNGSTDGSQDMIKEEFKWVRLIENSYNRGFSGANNQGMEVAKGDYIYLLNNDTEVTENWLKTVIEIAESDETIGVVGSGLLSDGKILTGTGEVNAAGISKSYPESFLETFIDDPRETSAVCGAAMLIKRKVIEDIGLLDEKFNPGYFEEIDFCARAKAKGYKVIFAPKSLIYHWESKKNPKPWMHYVINRNRIRYMLLNFSRAQLLQAAPWEILRIIKNVFRLRIHLLLKAYWANIKDIREIMTKRKERKHEPRV